MTPARSDHPPVDLTDLTPATAALLVIDMSRDFIAPGAPMECVEGTGDGEAAGRAPGALPPGRSAGHLRESRSPGARLRQGHAGRSLPDYCEGRCFAPARPGVEIWDELTPQPGDIVVEKIRQSGFTYTSLEAVLRELGVRTIIVSGVSTGACVECTARDAVSRDFDVMFLSDGTASSGLRDLGWGEVDADTLQRVFLTNFAYHFGRVASIAQVTEALAAKVPRSEAAVTT